MAEKSKKRVRVSKSKTLPKKKVAKLRKKAGGSNIGDYKDVKKSDFAGPAGGAPPGTYPINTTARAKSALKLAHNAPNPEGIKRAVYKKYPDLKANKKKKN